MDLRRNRNNPCGAGRNACHDTIQNSSTPEVQARTGLRREQPRRMGGRTFETAEDPFVHAARGMGSSGLHALNPYPSSRELPTFMVGRRLPPRLACPVPRQSWRCLLNTCPCRRARLRQTRARARSCSGAMPATVSPFSGRDHCWLPAYIASRAARSTPWAAGLDADGVAALKGMGEAQGASGTHGQAPGALRQARQGQQIPTVFDARRRAFMTRHKDDPAGCPVD